MVCSTSRQFVSGGLRRRIDSRVVSAEPRRDLFFFSELHRSRILRWAEDLSLVISPQFIMGKHNVLADALSRPIQILGSDAGGLQGFVQEVAGVNRPVCNVSNHR